MHGARAYYSDPQVGGRDRANWEWCGLLKPQSLLKLHTSQSKPTPSNHTQTVLPNRSNHLNKWVYRGHFHSIHYIIELWIYEWINPLIWPKPSWSNHSSMIESANWRFQLRSIWGVYCTSYSNHKTCDYWKASLRVFIMMVAGLPDTCCGLPRWVHLTQSCTGQQAHRWSLELGPKWEKLQTHSEKLWQIKSNSPWQRSCWEKQWDHCSAESASVPSIGSQLGLSGPTLEVIGCSPQVYAQSSWLPLL